MKVKSNMFFKRKIAIAIAIAIISSFYSFWLPVKVSATYKFEPNDGTLIVALSNPPLTKDSMLSFWDEHSEEFKKMVTDHKEYDSILFIKNNIEEEAKLEEEKLFQFCLPKQIKENKRCFNYKDRLLSVDFEKIDSESVINLIFGDAYSYKSGVCQLYIKETGDRKTYNCGT